MPKWTDDDLLRLDGSYAEAGVAFHARPMRAAMDILGHDFALGSIGDPEVEEIRSAYGQLVPEVDTSWPGMGVGLAASIDRVRKVVVAVVYGNPSITIEKGLGFSTREEWLKWCRNNSSIAASNAFAFADIFDLTYGIAQQQWDATAIRYWHMALSNLEDLTHILASGFSVASVVQPICMTAELAMKGSLIQLGDSPKALGSREIGHRHSVIAERLAKACPHRDDALVSTVVSKLPDYVASRYQDVHMNRLDVVRLALGVQFIAASALRRISGRDFALQLERDQWPGSRKPFFDI
nr:hypothetical protein HUO10_001486 [Paraburkholderia busanensis]